MIEAGAEFLRIGAPAWGFLGLQFALTGVLRASGNMVLTMVLTLVSQWMLQFPIAYVLSKHTGLGVQGIWWAFPAANVAIGLITLNFAANILGFTNVPIVDYLGERLACPVALENDANAAGLAEAILGAARYASSTMFITISTGIGGCIITDGQVWRGFHGIAGEIGHVTRVPDGPIPPSGIAGALEAVASGTAIARDATFVFRKPTSTAEVFRMAQDGDRRAEQIVHTAMRYLGMAIADVQKLLDPEVFVIGGGVASVGEYFYGHVQNYAREFARGFSDVTIVPAHFGVDAGVIGAAIAARQMTAKRQTESLV